MPAFCSFQILKNGFINPTATNAAVKLKSAKKITIKPAALKNIPDCKVLANLTEAKLIKARTGSVPKAKMNMVKAPLIKLPVVKE